MSPGAGPLGETGVLGVLGLFGDLGASFVRSFPGSLEPHFPSLIDSFGLAEGGAVSGVFGDCGDPGFVGSLETLGALGNRGQKGSWVTWSRASFLASSCHHQLVVC